MTEEGNDPIEILKAHSTAWGSGFLAARDGTVLGVGESVTFTPPPTFVSFLQHVPDTLLHAGQSTQGGLPEWRDYAVPFFQDGFGNAYFFDTRTPGNSGEYPILVWQHDDPNLDPTTLHPAATDFDEWLTKCVKGKLAQTAKRPKGKGCMLALLAFPVAAGIVYALVRRMA